MSIVRRAALHAAISLALALVALASIAAMPGARAWAAKGRMDGGSIQRGSPHRLDAKTEGATQAPDTATAAAP
jgi:hypothetical protein